MLSRKNLRNCAEMPPVNMKSILAVARGTTQDFTVSAQGNEQKIKLVVTDTMGIVDRTIITDTETAAVRHKNWMPMVELNFMLSGSAGLAYDSQLPASMMTTGDHQLLFNPSLILGPPPTGLYGWSFFGLFAGIGAISRKDR